MRERRRAQQVLHGRRQAEGLAEDAVVNVDVDVAAFLQTATTRQLKLLKVIALELDPRCEGRLH